MKTIAQYCNSSYVGQQIEAGLSHRGYIDALGMAAQEAIELSKDAYELAIPTAQATAERLLHTIHGRSFFQPPLSPIPSVVWSVLMQAKMHRAMQEADAEVSKLGDEYDMLSKLKYAVEELGAYKHRFLDEVAACDTCLNVYAKNWFGSIKGFTLQLGSLLQRCEGDVKLSVLENLSDEFEGVPHCELRARFVAKAAPGYNNDNAVNDVDRLTSSFALSSYRTGICLQSDPAYALGAFYAIEAHFPLECRRMLEVLRCKGYEESTLEIFSLHAEVDVEHAREWLDMIVKHVPPNSYDRVVSGAFGHQLHRKKMFDDMLNHTRTANS